MLFSTIIPKYDNFTLRSLYYKISPRFVRPATGYCQVQFFYWTIVGLFYIFVFSTVNRKYIHYRNILMTVFKPQTSGQEATTLPTEAQPLPSLFYYYFLDEILCFDMSFFALLQLIKLFTTSEAQKWGKDCLCKSERKVTNK